MTRTDQPVSTNERRRADHDERWLYATSFLYSFGLAVANVAFPLLALRVGYSASELGIIIASSAVAQIAARWMLAAVMRVVSNATIVIWSAILLTLSCAVVALSTHVVAVFGSALLQGTARAGFWTGSQTHIVRRDRPGASSIAMLNLAASVAMVIGPIVGGLVSDHSAVTALWIATGVSATAIVPTLFISRPPPFVANTSMSKRGFIRQPDIAVGLVANAMAGGWRGLLGSYVPVALERAGRSGGMIGVLITVANAAAIVGSFVSARVPPRTARTAIALSIVSTTLGTAITGFGSLPLVVLGLGLAMGGVATGVLQVLGLTIAAESVPRDHRGDAIAVTGTLRAGALFAAPFGVAMLLSVTALGPAVVVMTLVLAAPATLIRWRSSTGDAVGETSPAFSGE